MGAEPPRVNRVELRSSDVAASAAFYRQVVGLEPLTSDPELVELAAPGSRLPLLTIRPSGKRERHSKSATGLFHTAFRYPERSGLASALRRAAEAERVSITGASDHGVSEALYLDDPDGLGVELYWDRPRPRWPDPSEGERVGMYTKALDIEALMAAEVAFSPPEIASLGVEVGHVHLKVADPAAAIDFWCGEAGMELMTTFGRDAVFLAYNSYHHHIGANSWFTRGADPAPAEAPGIERIALLAGPERPEGDLKTPDGVPVVFEAPAA